MKILVTGGCGFIGSNFIQYMLRKYPHYQIMNLDQLTYAGNLENLQEIESLPNYHFVKGNIGDRELVDSLVSGKGGIHVVPQGAVTAIIHFAAESHVDRSIMDPEVFLKTNIMGTQVLLEAARKYKISRFVQISTDEVYGSLGEQGYFSEVTPVSPNSPYSASKASADLMVQAYHHTYGLPTIITRCSNNYGPYQFPEKLIPLVISNALEDQPIPVYGKGVNIRDWLHVNDHCSAIDLALHHGELGEVYNIGGSNEWKNIDIVKKILTLLNKPLDLIQFVQDRPGHDQRYAIDSSKIQANLGWKPEYDFEKGITETVQWYLDHQNWWKRIKSGEYMDYYQKQYEER